MKKLMIFATFISFCFLVGDAVADKPIKEEVPPGPVTIGLVFQMPDGTVVSVDLPTDEPLFNDYGEVGIETIIIPPIITLPPITLWQSGWFYYGGTWLFGWVGPGDWVYLMTVDQGGILHYWVWNTNFWVYKGTL